MGKIKQKLFYLFIYTFFVSESRTGQTG